MTEDTASDGRRATEGNVVDEIGPFAIVPLWVVQAVSGTALAVYCALGTFANSGGSCFPSKAKIAERAGVSQETVKRALRELEQAGAVTRQPRYVDGRQTSNDYYLHRVQPGTGTGSDVTGEGVRGDPAELDQITRPENYPPVGPPAVIVADRRMIVDRTPAVPAHLDAAVEILDYWNQKTGQALTAKTWLAKIVMRLREHPGLGVEDHKRIIDVALAPENVWWKGPASPSVVYGNDAQFERCIAQTTAPRAAPAEEAYEIAARAAEEARRQP